MNALTFSKKIKTEYLGALALLVTMAPFFTLCFFAHPSFLDDYCFATKTLEMGLVDAFLNWYNNWTGRYALCFLMSLNPLIIHSIWLCKVLLFLLILGVPFASLYLVKAIFPKQRTGFYLCLIAVFNFFYFFQLPSVSDGLYWMTGSVAYQLPNICLIVILTLLIQARKKKNYLILRYFSICLLAIVMIGANEISMLTFLIFLAGLIVLDLQTKQPLQPGLLVVLLVSIVCSGFVIFSPGNDVRGSLFPLSHNLVQALWMTAIGMGYYIMQWMVLASLLSIVTLYILKRYGLNWDIKNNRISLSVSLLFFAIILSAGFFVPAWATGQMPNARAINILFLIFLLGFFYHLFWAQQLFFKSPETLKMDNKIIIIVVLGLFFITFYPGKGINNNIKSAYVDLLSGKANYFDSTLCNLYKTGVFIRIPDEKMPISLKFDMESASYKSCASNYLKTYYK